LWAAGEVTGGLHGSNRLMGNSLLDITVFGRRAGMAISRDLPVRKIVTLEGLKKYRAALKNISDKSVTGAITAPQLFPAGINMKMDFSQAPSKEKSNGEDPPAPPEKSFEPPDPFFGR
jgi:succinate dehydrogenase/fumarate reductase flavoprotein subunit